MIAIKAWTESIIIVVIISIIIEMLLPEGSNKKYVKVISGLYILYTIISPILNIDNDFDINKITNSITNAESLSAVSDTEIVDTYIHSLQSNLRVQIEKLGYSVDKVVIAITSDYSDIAYINIKMKSLEYDETKIKDVVLTNFEMSRDKINIA